MIGAAKGPPPPPNYITLAGAKRLQTELGYLRTKERPKVVREVSDAAHQAHPSENAEYIYGNRRLREIDRRVRFLRRRLEGMVIVEQPPADAQRVFFGAWVEIEAADGARARYRIVGPDEFDMAPGYISMDSPLGRALLRRSLDEQVSVATPACTSEE